MNSDPGFNGHSRLAYQHILLLLLVALLLAAYVLLRYRGFWGETDTSVFTGATRSVLDSGRLAPPEREIYPNGYGFQALALALIHASGMRLADLQLYTSRLLVLWLVLPAWLLYRELTGSRRGATLATLILFAQPEFLFAILRGTHEKFTRGLMLIALYLLVRSLRPRRKVPQLTAFLIVFYLAGYALIAFNDLMATSFIAAIALALVLLWFASRSIPHAQRALPPVIARLLYATLSLMAIAFIFPFYAYPPALAQLRVFQGVADRISALFLQVGETAVNPYAYVTTGWVSLPVYFAVSLADWLLLVISTTIWIRQSFAWGLRRGRSPGLGELILWAFYGAFAFQAALSILVDVSGAIAANLQHRIFPSFAMLAAPLAGRWLAEFKPRKLTTARWVHALVGASIALLAVLSTFKATMEPLLSNKWLQVSPAELQAIEWAKGPLAQRSIWTEWDERLIAATGILNNAGPIGVTLDAYEPNPGTRDYLISELTRQRSLRISQPLPIQAHDLLTYDNGQAQIFHLQPLTPYQR